jgi:hypothetical protein
MNKDEPPSCTRLESSLFFVGKNSRGNWVVQDGRGIRGGLFLDRAGALKFAKSESGGSPAVVMMTEPFELDMTSVRDSLERREGLPPVAAIEAAAASTLRSTPVRRPSSLRNTSAQRRLRDFVDIVAYKLRPA